MIFKKSICPVCKKAYVDRPAVYNHMESQHRDEIPDGIPADQFFYDITHKYTKPKGCCICHKETQWNTKTHKYARLCGREECNKEVRRIFHERMMKKYHTDNLAVIPEHQKKMLHGRSISGTYEFEDGGKIDYVGSYELDFLRYCENVMSLKSTDILGPSPHTYYYNYDGTKHFYIPDFFIPDLNLEIEIKDGGDNPNMHHKIQDVDKVKETLKDRVLLKQRDYNYIKIVNKNYDNFNKLFRKLSQDDLNDSERFSKIKIISK